MTHETEVKFHEKLLKLFDVVVEIGTALAELLRAKAAKANKELPQ